MNLSEIVTKLQASGLSAKLARDGSNVVVGCGDKGFFRVLVNSTHPHAVNGLHIANYATCGRAAANSAMADIRQALAQ